MSFTTVSLKVAKARCRPSGEYHIAVADESTSSVINVVSLAITSVHITNANTNFQKCVHMSRAKYLPLVQNIYFIRVVSTRV